MSEALPRTPESESPYRSPLKPLLPQAPGQEARWGKLYGCSSAITIAAAAEQHPAPLLVIVPDTRQAARLEHELRFFCQGSGIEILPFPDWETLPYDLFSPHHDIVSQRIETLYKLPNLTQGILIVPVATLMQRLMPLEYLRANSLVLDNGDRLNPEQMRLQLEQAGYRCVSQVMEHGEFAVRGSLMDLFPMGSTLPYRIDLFDNEVESIRTFDPETQRTIDKVEAIHLLPAREYPLTDEAISKFRQAWRKRFEGDPQQSLVYREISQGVPVGGIEYYLPLFFDNTHSLLDYIPSGTLLVNVDDIDHAATQYREQIEVRYEQRRHDQERPLLTPEELFLTPEYLHTTLHSLSSIQIQRFEIEATETGRQAPAETSNYATSAPPVLLFQARAERPTAALQAFLSNFEGRTLLIAESTGRRELLLDMLRASGLHPKPCDHWQAFLHSDLKLAITVAPLEQGALLKEPALNIIAESQLFGERAQQRRTRRSAASDPENILRNLTDLDIGAAVVHEEHGVGRYLGLQKLNISDIETEFLTLEYSGGDKLYVPVSSLHLISRYTGTSPENAPLHKLGSDHWVKAKRKAAERARDVAAELLDIYSRRAARKGNAFHLHENEYASFAATFPFEETEDQQNTIHDVIENMCSDQPMDRVVCGDVGFGKTEVAMRAAFVAVQDGRQVAVLVPTTLLAQQHYQNFQDRFADWPVRIEVISRFKGKKEQDEALQALATGKVDIIIGTHKLIQSDVKFSNLGLVIIDEEHRFGVRQKERLKALRTEVDILNLTATPIPRTLNMALAGMRDLSIIATPPTNRVAIKTFVCEWDNALLLEAFQRELKRGGQVYFLHNEVSSIEKMAHRLRQLIPEARVQFAHGQMRESELEQVMLDFHHQRFNVLVSTTIIESGIDIPNANTIIINRADKLGLAQLHQIRGRVGRSHHRAYAYLLIPGRKSITPDALKRLEAIESLEDLGAGFMLATHDLEIRGAGELLGDEQSGQIQEIGFTLYTELLERAVRALKSGKQPELDHPLDHGPEIDLHVPALLPEDYLPDVHTRLTCYKRIASSNSKEALRELQVEMIDRFGLLPEAAKALFRITELKLLALPLGISKIDASDNGGRILFGPEPDVDSVEIIRKIQTQPRTYRLDGQEKLRFMHDLEEPEERFTFVEQLLHDLTPSPPRDERIQ